jgi:exosortase
VPATSWWGLAFVAAGEALRLLGARYYVQWFEMLALLPSLAGIALLVGGWRALRWAAPAIAFLFFMVPLPYRVEHALGAPLQSIATRASTYALQTLGLPAVAEGHVILLGESTRIGVVEACNGLGMLFMFLAYAVAVVLVVPRSWVDKLVLVLSAIPIAVAANVARITVTGWLYEVASDELAEAVYHDLAGWLMMPLALAAFYLVLTLLSNLFVMPAAPVPVNPARLATSLGPGPGPRRPSA